MKMEKIAVGTDFSEPSNLAVAQAMHLARHVGAEVVLVHAGAIAEFGALSKDAEGWREKVFAQNRKELEEFRARLAGQGVEVSQAFHEGLPEKSLGPAAAKLSADILVVGTHSFSGITRFLLGNVAERVVKTSDQSVLVARSAGQAGGFRRILLPLDLEESAAAVIVKALALASPGAEIDLLHCWQVPRGLSERWPGDGPGLQEIRNEKRTQVDTKLRSLSQEHSPPGTQIGFEQIEASPREGIVQRLESADYDLVIVGSAGSVAQATARHAPCSVLVLKD
jgi:nucleotide-binding universal stress UspA family protein